MGGRAALMCYRTSLSRRFILSEDPPQDDIWASCSPWVDFTECVGHTCRLDGECLVVGGWSRTDVHPCSFHLEAAEEQVELLCLHSTAAGQAVGVALPGDVTCPLSCPAGVRVAKVVLDPLFVGCLSIPDALFRFALASL